MRPSGGWLVSLAWSDTKAEKLSRICHSGTFVRPLSCLLLGNMSRGKKHQNAVVTFRLPADLRDGLEREADNAGVSMSKALRNLTERLIKGEIRLWPRGLADLRPHPPTEAELLEVAELLVEARQQLRGSVEALSGELESLELLNHKALKTIRRVSRSNQLYDLIQGMLGESGEPGGCSK